jgi:hypothetical protein
VYARFSAGDFTGVFKEAGAADIRTSVIGWVPAKGAKAQETI